MRSDDKAIIRCAADWAGGGEVISALEGAVVREVGLARHHGAGPCMLVLLDLDADERAAILSFVTVRDFSVDLHASLRAPEATEVDQHSWTVDFGPLRVQAEHCNVTLKHRRLPPLRRLIVAPSAGDDIGFGDSYFDMEYLQGIEALAQEVVRESWHAGGLRWDDQEGQSDVQLAINQLARKLRMAHWRGDGCCPEGDDAGD